MLDGEKKIYPMAVSFSPSHSSSASSNPNRAPLPQAPAQKAPKPLSTRRRHELLSQSLPLFPPHLVDLTSKYFGLPLFRYPPKPEGWFSSQITEENVRNLVVEKAELVAADLERRQNEYKIDRQILNQGFWYPTEYLQALAKIQGSAKRIEALKERNAVSFGLAPKGFDHLIDPETSQRCPHYKLREGTAAQGLNAIWNSVCFIDCAMALQLVFYEVFLEVLGECLFNDLFQINGFFPLQLTYLLQERSQFEGILQYIPFPAIASAADRSMLRAGDQAFFKNSSAYRTKHPFGYWRGFHMICMNRCTQNSPSRFTGLGAPSKGLLEGEILELFAKELRKPLADHTRWCSGAILHNVAWSQQKALSDDASDQTRDEKPDGLEPRVIRISAHKLQKLVRPREQAYLELQGIRKVNKTTK